MDSDHEQDDETKNDSADEDEPADTAEDDAEADIAPAQHDGPSFQSVGNFDVENVNRVKTTEAPRESTLSKDALLTEFFHLHTSMSFISKHIKPGTTPDIISMFHDVKTRVAEIQTLLNSNVDGSVVNDEQNTDDINTKVTYKDIPTASDADPDKDMVRTYLLRFHIHLFD